MAEEKTGFDFEASKFSKEVKFVKPSDMTIPADDEDVEVYFLMSPLMLEEAGDALGEMGQFHAGVGFIHKTSGLQVSTQFYADAFGTALCVPVVDRADDSLKFSDGGELGSHEGKLDFKYWKHAQHLATIKGPEYAKYVEWLKADAPKYSKYSLFNLRATGDPIVQPCLQTFEGNSAATQSLTCFDACQTILQKVKEIAPEKMIEDPAKIFRNDIYLYMKPGSEPPRKLDMTPGSLDRNKAFVFYEALTEALGPDPGMNGVALMAEKIPTLGLGYAIYHDQNRNFWLYEPDSPAANITFDPEELKRVLPLNKPPPGSQ